MANKQVQWILCTLIIQIVDSDVEIQNEEGSITDHATCPYVTQFVALPILNSYYMDVISIMTGTVAMIPYIMNQDTEATNNHIINQPFPTSSSSMQTLLGNLLIDMFNPALDVDDVYFAYEDVFHTSNITLKRRNGTLVTQQPYNSSLCSSKDSQCFSYRDSTLSKWMFKSNSKLQIKWKLYCDHHNSEFVIGARLLLYLNDASNKGVMDKQTSATR